MSFFQNINFLIFGYFDPTFLFWIVTINIFWGDLSGVSVETATVVFTELEALTHPAGAFNNVHPIPTSTQSSTPIITLLGVEQAVPILPRSFALPPGIM